MIGLCLDSRRLCLSSPLTFPHNDSNNKRMSERFDRCRKNKTKRRCSTSLVINIFYCRKKLVQYINKIYIFLNYKTTNRRNSYLYAINAENGIHVKRIAYNTRQGATIFENPCSFIKLCSDKLLMNQYIISKKKIQPTKKRTFYIVKSCLYDHQ